jgi:hypothetical protein
MKEIKTESWEVYTLVDYITNDKISKIKTQRKKKWTSLPISEKSKHPNEKAYISFLYKTGNSVHAIMFGSDNNSYKNIDGNNRINAIMHFIKKPYDLFSENYQELFEAIDKYIIDKESNNSVKLIFENMSYKELMKFKYIQYFHNKGLTSLYNACLKKCRDELEEYIDNLQTKFKIDGVNDFGEKVKVCVNLFVGYTDDELNNTYLQVNEYNHSMDEIDLIASRLYSVIDFQIHNNVILTEIQNKLIKFYEEKAKDEVLACYTYHEKNKNDMNAYDFMVGFQNYLNELCPLIENVELKDKPLLFKIYQVLYKGNYYSIFNTENINDFITKMMHVVTILNKIKEKIFSDKLCGLGNTFNSSSDKFKIKTNSMYVVVCAIISFINEKTSDDIICKRIEKTILYHLIVKEIKDSETKQEYNSKNFIKYEAGGETSNKHAEEVYQKPLKICNSISRDIFKNVLINLIQENKRESCRYLENGKDKKNKRRDRKFFENILILYYYRKKIPTDFLYNKFWIEHISPFSSSWSNDIDIDRLGNIVPIIDSINNKRKNNHISEYKNIEKKIECDFIRFIDMIPSIAEYDKIVSHKDKKPEIINNEIYNQMCCENETKYINTFLDALLFET